MSRLFLLFSFTVATGCICLLGGDSFLAKALAQPGQPESLMDRPEWKRVNEAMKKGLPKTAIQELQSITEKAIARGRDAEAIRAIALRIAMEGNIQGNKASEKITRLEKEIEAADESLRPVMKVLLANWYWQYFQQNRWRFQQRSQARGGIGDDIETWDLTRILEKIDDVFTEALSDAESLKQTPIRQYGDLFDKGNVSDAYRPTVYDVLAHYALQFYSSGEHHGSRPSNFFVAQASSPILSDAPSFIAWVPETSDEHSSTIKSIKLYQELLQFHRDDQDPRAFEDADLLRVIFAESEAVGTG